jgi:hypothetical protein
MDLQHHYNNYTTTPHMGWSPVCGAHPHVRSCCTIIVPVKCRNQIPYFFLSWGSSGCNMDVHLGWWMVLVGHFLTTTEQFVFSGYLFSF